MGNKIAHGRTRNADGRQRAGRRHAALRNASATHPGSTRHHATASRPAFAAIDLGTNNCRLLIAEPNGHGFQVIDAFSRIVRLGEGLGARGVLSEAAMARTI